MFSPFRWFVALTMFIVTASTSLILIAPMTLVESIIKESAMDPSQIMTLVMSVFNLFVVVAVFTTGALINKLGVNKIYIAGMVMIILGNLIALFFGNSAIGLFFARALQGAGTGPIMTSIALLARQWFKPEEQGIVTGLQGMAVSVGIALSFMLVPHLNSSAAHWGEVFEILSWVNVLGIILTFVVMFGPKPAISLADESNTENTMPNNVKLLSFIVLVGAFCFFGGAWLQQSILTAGPSFIGTELARGAIVSGDLMSYYSIAFAIGSPISGIIAGIWLKGQKDHLVIAICFIVSAIFSFILMKSDTNFMLVVALLALGFVHSFINPIVMSFIARNYPVHLIGKVAGFSMTFVFVAGILAPIMCSLLLKMTEAYSASFISVAVVSVLGVLISLNLKAKYLNV